MEKAELRKEQSDEDEWGTAPKVAAIATATAATVVPSKAEKQNTEESDYSADWGDNDLMDKGVSAQKPVAEVKRVSIPE